MKKIAVLLLSCVSLGTAAQTVTKYYDADWLETPPAKAMYYAEFTKTDGGYKCFSYWKNTKKKREESFYADTSMNHPNGLQKVYGKNGKLEDSLFFKTDGTLAESFHYYPNRQLECHYVSTANGKGEVKEAYDEAGQRLKNYVFAQAAQPKGGIEKWNAFIKKTATRDFTTAGTEKKNVTVKLRFVVDENGNVMKPTVVESSANRTVDLDALRVIGLSPEWIPAVYKNKPFRWAATQAITYELLPAKN